MKFDRKAIPVSEAQQRVAERIKRMDAERLPLLACLGRVLAEPLTADHPLPHFRKSGMDGYAVRAEDLVDISPEKPAVLEVNQTIACGETPVRSVGAGEAARIMTGAPLPEGADTVVMFEMTEEAVSSYGKRSVIVKKTLPRGTNVSQIGDEIAEHDRLLEAGTVIGAGEAALLAAFGSAHPKVFRQPRAAIITTGSELIEADEPLAFGKVRNSNRYMLAGLVRSAGGNVVSIRHVPDRVEEIAAAIAEAAAEADLVLTSGGASVGDFDVVSAFFTDHKESLLFNKVAMRPGSVTTAGTVNGTLMFGLSGNPGACFVGFELFVRPALAGMQGKPAFPLPEERAILSRGYEKPSGFTRYVRGRTFNRDAAVYAEPAGRDRSETMLSIKDSDCLIVIPPGSGGLPEGAAVSVIPLK